MAMQESGEMYLETIYVLSRQSSSVRSVDVAEEMRLSKPSVSRALAKLKDESCVIVGAEGHIALTDKGRMIAERTYERQQVLTEEFMMLGVSQETAAADACKFEHDISDETFAAMKRHVNQYGKRN